MKKSLKQIGKTVPETLRILLKLGKEHLPTVLTVLGIGCGFATCVLTAEAAPKAVKAIEHEEDTKMQTTAEGLSTVEKLRVGAPYYWKAAVCGCTAIGLVLYANHVSMSRIASMAALYSASKGELKAVKDKILETDGKKKLDEIEHAVAQERREAALKNPFCDITETGCGQTIFVDEFTGYRFYSSVMEVSNAICELNAELHSRRNRRVGLDEFYRMLHIAEKPGVCQLACFELEKRLDDEEDTTIRPIDLMDYGPVGQGDPTPAVLLRYSEYLSPTGGFLDRAYGY